EDQSPIKRAYDAAARLRQWRCRAPGIGCRIIDLVPIDHALVIDALTTADQVNPAVDGDRGHVVARACQRRGRAPLAAGGIIDVMSGDERALTLAPTEHVNLAV